MGGRCDLLPNINLKSLLINEEYYEPTLDVEEGSLFRVSSGMSIYYNSNCQIYPSKYFKELFNCHPDKYNPLIWNSVDGKVAMRFEMISNPIRNTVQQHYNRQPILFRWLCNKNILDEVLNKQNLLLK